MSSKFGSYHSLKTSPHGPRDVDIPNDRPVRLHIHSIRYDTPMEREGRENLERVRTWYQQHLGGKQKECAEALGLSVMAVNRHVRTLRQEWLEGRVKAASNG